MMAFRKVVMLVGLVSFIAFEFTARNLRHCSSVSGSKLDEEDVSDDASKPRGFPK
jgi:hypothetical protein